MGRPLEKLEDRKRVQIKSLKAHHRSMVRERVAGGLRNNELAKIYGMTEVQISKIVNSPAFLIAEAALEDQMEDTVIAMRGRLNELAPVATGVLARNVLDFDDDIKVRQLATKTAIEILDRVDPKKSDGSGGLRDVNIGELNVDAKVLSTGDLRDSVFDLLAESGD